MRPSTCWEPECPPLLDTNSSNSMLWPCGQVEGLWAIVDFPAMGIGTTQKITGHLSFLAYCVEIDTQEVRPSHLVCKVLNRWPHPKAGFREKGPHCARCWALPQQAHIIDVHCGAHRQASGIQIPNRDQLLPCLQRKEEMGTERFKKGLETIFQE